MFKIFKQAPSLTEDEEKLVSALRKGPLPQKVLFIRSGMNPVKFNKVLRALEERRIAKRNPHGRENTVKLL